MDIHLIRHPKTVAALGTCYGSLDLEASPDALEEAATRLAPKIPPGSKIISSPQKRALALAERLGPVEATEPSLVEMGFGEWEGRKWNTIPREEIDEWDADVAGFAPPGGESLKQVSERVHAWWQTVEEAQKAPVAFPFMRSETSGPVDSLVIVSHGGPLRLIATHILGASIEASMKLEISWGHRARVRCSEHGAQLVEWNLP